MVDQATIQTISIVFTGISISLAAFYYINTLRNTRKNQQLTLETRQAQLFMSLYETHRSPELRKLYTRVRDREWTDFEDWQKKYGPENNPDASIEYQSLMNFFDGVGLLVKRGLIDISLVHDLMFISTNRIWNLHKSVIYNVRISSGYPSLWEHFEYLSNELIKYHEENPELKT
jgi:hypothetical protein